MGQHDKERESEAAIGRPMSPLAAALWTVGLALLVQVCVGVTAAARPGAETDIVNLAGCEVLATSLVVFAMVRVHAREASLRAMLGLRPCRVGPLLLAAIAGAGLDPLLSNVESALLARWPIEDQAVVESTRRVMASSSHLVLVVAALAVVPLARELYFRGIVYTGIEPCAGERGALVATSVFFACSYLDWQQMPTALALGLVLAWMRGRSRTVLAPVVAQLASGAVEGIPVLRGRDPAADFVYPAAWVAGGAVLAFGALAWMAVRRPARD